MLEAEALRATARIIESGNMDEGICATAFFYVHSVTEIAPYAADSVDRFQYQEGAPFYAYPPRTEPEARALAAYMIALQIEEDAARESLSLDAREIFDTLLLIPDDIVLDMATRIGRGIVGGRRHAEECSVADPIKLPNPGSDAAIAKGCKCPVLDNHHGQGCGWGPNTFYINAECPLYGYGSVPDATGT